MLDLLSPGCAKADVR